MKLLIMIMIIFMILLVGVTAILFKLFFSKKFDIFEEEFERTHRENFINRFHCDAFNLTHHND